MSSMMMSRWIAPTLLAAALAATAALPAPAHAQDSLTRVLVNVADVIFNNGQPYYRYGNRGYNDRLVVARDRYGRPVYYRQVPYNYNTQGYSNRLAYDQYGRRIYDQYGRRINYAPRYVNDYRQAQPYGHAYGYRDAKCNKHGKCKIKYDDRHDRDGDRDDRRHGDDDD